MSLLPRKRKKSKMKNPRLVFSRVTRKQRKEEDFVAVFIVNRLRFIVGRTLNRGWEFWYGE
jgi:hypothetical protein